MSLDPVKRFLLCKLRGLLLQSSCLWLLFFGSSSLISNRCQCGCGAFQKTLPCQLVKQSLVSPLEENNVGKHLHWVLPCGQSGRLWRQQEKNSGHLRQCGKLESVWTSLGGGHSSNYTCSVWESAARYDNATTHTAHHFESVIVILLSTSQSLIHVVQSLIVRLKISSCYKTNPQITDVGFITGRVFLFLCSVHVVSDPSGRRCCARTMSLLKFALCLLLLAGLLALICFGVQSEFPSLSFSIRCWLTQLPCNYTASQTFQCRSEMLQTTESFTDSQCFWFVCLFFLWLCIISLKMFKVCIGVNRVIYWVIIFDILKVCVET